MTSDKKKLLSKAWLWVLIVVTAFAVWGTAFYLIDKPSSEKVLKIWVGKEDWLSDADKENITSIALSFGMEKCSFNEYDSSDGMYSQAFSTKAATIDLFIIDKDEALELAETELFQSIEGFNVGLNYNDKLIGINLSDDMCLLVCAYSDKSETLLNAVVQYFAEK